MLGIKVKICNREADVDKLCGLGVKECNRLVVQGGITGKLVRREACFHRPGVSALWGLRGLIACRVRVLKYVWFYSFGPLPTRETELVPAIKDTEATKPPPDTEASLHSRQANKVG